ncbi:ABC transporter [Companilactobacillus tucceti DSM 20183]|uniref:ABC transporter n=1 Tax=Companilactobacillus tucceti DSM 20183 TaxID=1423811 RepID=A0A0R1J814_9LACO|nr:ABC transporter ATP-binding protein/permease [Companilactobacillus tucceti]KRK64276.1 ABC transporter [Companilactobacillus tucceti DSM 20183]
MSLLELKDVKKSFMLGKKKFPVLKGINLELNRGEFVSILGESGGGKTTLLNTIGGLDSQFEGDILVDGKSLKKGSDKALDNYRSHTVGFVFQSFHLISHLTILENVLVPLEMSSLSKSERVERAKDLLKKVGLEEHVTKHTNQLSGGQKQRVAIARALANDPEIIIADEPTGALDSQNTEEVLKILDDIAKEGKLVIAVTHSQTVADYGTRIVHLADGVIDSDKTIRDSYKIEENINSNKKITHLSFMDTFRLAWEHMLYTKGRNILIILGAAIGIFSVILMLGLGSGVTGYINGEMTKQINPNAIQVTKNLPQNGANSDTDSINITKSDMKNFKDIDNVQKVEKAYFLQSPKLNYNKKNTSIPYFQTWNNTEKTGDITKGSKPSNGEIILLKSDAQKLDKKHYKNLVGKTVKIYISTLDDDKKPTQVAIDLKVSGIIKSGSSAITYDTLKSAAKKSNVTIKPNFATLTVNETKNVKPVQDKIKSYQMTVKNKKQNKYMITGVGAIIDQLNTYLNLAFYVLAGVAGISLIVSAIMIIVVLYISVSERTQEIGILRAIGARKKDIRNMFVSESFLIGLVSGVFAVLIAYGVQLLINNATQSAFKATIVSISPGNAIFGIVISIIISLLAALAPARRAAKLDPRDSLTDE